MRWSAIKGCGETSNRAVLTGIGTKDLTEFWTTGNSEAHASYRLGPRPIMLIYITDHACLTPYVDNDNSDDSHSNPNDNTGVSNIDDDHDDDDEDDADGNSLFSLF